MSKFVKYSSDDYQNFFDSDLSKTDPDLYNSIKLELERQQQHIELIASENVRERLSLQDGDQVNIEIWVDGSLD